MALAVNALKEQVEKAKESLKSVDEHIKKITGRDPNEPRPNIEVRRLSGGQARTSRESGAVLGRRVRDTQEPVKDTGPPKKKVAVFSRLGPAGGGRRVIISGRRRSRNEDEEDNEEDDEDEEENIAKPAVQSSVVSTAKKITKTELINAQNVGERGKARNRRMFGVLLGTLARFQSDSGNRGQQNKQAQKQKEVETRLEEQTQAERRQLASQRRTLFNERRAQQKRIQLLEQKVALADELVEWEKEWDKKSNFLMTKASPGVFFMPKDFTPETQRALKESKGRIKEIIEKHRKSVAKTMNSYDDEIKLLEGKLENENGKGENVHKNVGGGLKGKKGNIVPVEPEEEMDLDSMGPQVEIKVEMDENEVDESRSQNADGSNNDVKQEPSEKQNQNHDIATDMDVEETGGEFAVKPEPANNKEEYQSADDESHKSNTETQEQNCVLVKDERDEMAADDHSHTDALRKHADEAEERMTNEESENDGGEVHENTECVKNAELLKTDVDGDSDAGKPCTSDQHSNDEDGNAHSSSESLNDMNTKKPLASKNNKSDKDGTSDEESSQVRDLKEQASEGKKISQNESVRQETVSDKHEKNKEKHDLSGQDLKTDKSKEREISTDVVNEDTIVKPLQMEKRSQDRSGKEKKKSPSHDRKVTKRHVSKSSASGSESEMSDDRSRSMSRRATLIKKKAVRRSSSDSDKKKSSTKKHKKHSSSDDDSSEEERNKSKRKPARKQECPPRQKVRSRKKSESDSDSGSSDESSSSSSSEDDKRKKSNPHNGSNNSRTSKPRSKESSKKRPSLRRRSRSRDRKQSRR